MSNVSPTIPSQSLTLDEVKEYTGIISNDGKWNNTGTPLSAENLNVGNDALIDLLDAKTGYIRRLVRDLMHETEARKTDTNALNSSITTEENNRIEADDTLQENIDNHTSNITNPHKVTKSQVGLGNVDNKSVATIKSEFTGSVAENNEGFVTGADVYSEIYQEGVNRANSDINLQNQLDILYGTHNTDVSALQTADEALSRELNTTKQDIATEASRAEAAEEIIRQSIPTKVGQLSNDIGFLTEHQSLENYYIKEEVDALISDAVLGEGVLNNYYTKNEIDSLVLTNNDELIFNCGDASNLI